MEQAVPSSSDVDMRAQLALDLPSEEQATFTRPCTLRETATWLVLFRFLFRSCCFTWENIFSKFATFHLVFSWQKGDRPDNDPLGEMSKSMKVHRTRKSDALKKSGCVSALEPLCSICYVRKFALFRDKQLVYVPLSCTLSLTSTPEWASFFHSTAESFLILNVKVTF